jgi:uroporphyrinogen decarboxylase
MNSRERVLAALNHKEPDRVPIWFGGDSTGLIGKTYENLGDYLGIQFWRQMTSYFDTSKYDERIMQRLHSDLRFLTLGAGGTNVWTPVEVYDDGTYRDEYNIHLRKMGYFHSSIIKNPLRELKTVKDIINYDQWVDNKIIAEKAVEGLEDEGKLLWEKGEFAICGNTLWSQIELAAMLRGLDQWSIDLIKQPEIADAIMKKLWDYHVPIYENYLKVVGKYVDIIFISDDLGMQTGLLMSPKLYRDYLKAWHKKRVDFIKERTNGLPVIMHTCGSVYPLIPDLIEIGLDGIQSIQPFAKDMEPEKLKNDFGDKFLFVGGLDHQIILRQSINEIKEFIDRLLRIFAPGGGYLFASTHDIPPDIPPQNIVEAYDYLFKNGSYPIKM